MISASDLLLYQANGIDITAIAQEPESKEYGACTFMMNGKPVRYRIARLTPTKAGLFVTLWKRSAAGPIAPFDLSDNNVLFIISATENGRSGQFIFPEEVLSGKGIISGNSKGGKRAMRVYPPWDIELNKQAAKTQAWQADYFLETTPGMLSPGSRLKKLMCPVL